VLGGVKCDQVVDGSATSVHLSSAAQATVVTVLIVPVSMSGVYAPRQKTVETEVTAASPEILGSTLHDTAVLDGTDADPVATMPWTVQTTAVLVVTAADRSLTITPPDEPALISVLDVIAAEPPIAYPPVADKLVLVVIAEDPSILIVTEPYTPVP